MTLLIGVSSCDNLVRFAGNTRSAPGRDNPWNGEPDTDETPQPDSPTPDPDVTSPDPGPIPIPQPSPRPEPTPDPDPTGPGEDPISDEEELRELVRYFEIELARLRSENERLGYDNRMLWEEVNYYRSCCR